MSTQDTPRHSTKEKLSIMFTVTINGRDDHVVNFPAICYVCRFQLEEVGFHVLDKRDSIFLPLSDTLAIVYYNITFRSIFYMNELTDVS